MTCRAGLVVSSTFIVSIPSMGSVVAYRETFAFNAANADREGRLTEQGWNATVNGRVAAGRDGQTIFSNTDSVPDGTPGTGDIANTPAGSDLTDGLLFFSRGFADWAAWTDEVAGLGLRASDLHSIRVRARNNQPDVVFAIVEVDGAWWVNENLAFSTVGAAGFVDLTMDLRTGRWASFDLALEQGGADGDLATTGDNIASVATLTSFFTEPAPSGIVTAVGLFVPDVRGNNRYDLFELRIPAPSAGVSLAAVALAASRRRR